MGHCLSPTPRSNQFERCCQPDVGNIRNRLVRLRRPRFWIVAPVRIHLDHVRYPAFVWQAERHLWPETATAHRIRHIRSRKPGRWARSVVGSSHRLARCTGSRRCRHGLACCHHHCGHCACGPSCDVPRLRQHLTNRRSELRRCSRRMVDTGCGLAMVSSFMPPEGSRGNECLES